MKKMLAILLLVSAVVGMTIPAMAETEAESQSDAVNTADTDIALDASNYAAHTVSVSLDVAAQSNNIGENLAISGDNANSADATFDADANAEDATSGEAESGGVGSGSAYAEDDDATSEAESGDATSGNAKNIAEVEDNSNVADASDNDMTTGNVDNVVVQVNAVVQIVPVEIYNDQTVTQDVSVDNHQHASSNPVTDAIETTETNTEYDADLDLEDIDDSGLEDIEIEF